MTVCLKERAKSTPDRMREIERLLNEVAKKKNTPHLCILPGGTFSLNKIRLENPDKAEQIKIITRTGLVAPLKKICKKHKLNIIFGIDTKDGLDQCVCHVDKSGIQRITRKIFPVKGDEADDWVSHVEDAKIENRVAKIKGVSFLLAACYDMYGAEIIVKYKNSKRLQNILRISKGGETASRKSSRSRFNELKKELISNWCKSVDSSDIGVACIHAFAKNGEQGSGIAYWQRFGITNQFPFLKRKAVFGAAHYTNGRKFPADTSRAVLADGKSIKRNYIDSYILLNGNAFVRLWNIDA